MTIVGVIRNERVQRDLRAPVDEIAYVPIAQAPRMQVKLPVRTRGDADGRGAGDSRSASASSIRSWRSPTSAPWKRSGSGSLSGLTEPVVADRHLRGAVGAARRARPLRRRRRTASAQQRREIGIRMALGARSNDVLSMVVRHALAPIGIGLGVGLAGAVGLTRVTQSLLFEVSALDPCAFAIAAVSMMAIGRARGADPGPPRHARRSHHRPAVGITATALPPLGELCSLPVR